MAGKRVENGSGNGKGKKGKDGGRWPGVRTNMSRFQQSRVKMGGIIGSLILIRNPWRHTQQHPEKELRTDSEGTQAALRKQPPGESQVLDDVGVVGLGFRASRSCVLFSVGVRIWGAIFVAGPFGGHNLVGVHVHQLLLSWLLAKLVTNLEFMDFMA